MSIYFMIILLILKTSESKMLEVKCPHHCLCDTFENLRRATCTDKNLVMLESFLPNQTQILDISHNQISELRQHIFQEENLLSLKSLNMSHNKLSQIHVHAFEGMINLKSLDVSYNYMKYILSHWFEDTVSLQELYLRGNFFIDLRDSLFTSSSLKVIDLSQCKIAYIETNVFKEATNLKTLYLQENILFQFRIENINTSLHLELLNLTGNELNCNNVNRLSKYCNSKGITLLSKSCDNVNKTKKFDKMILHPSLSPANEKNSWLINDEEENLNCNYTTVVQNKNETINANILMDIFKLSPIISIITLIVCGFLIGLIVGCTIQIKSSSNSLYEEPFAELIGSEKRKSLNCLCFRLGKKYSYSTNRKSRKILFKSTLSLNKRRNNRGEDGSGLIEHLIDFPESTPVPQRRTMDSMTSFQ